ncbi:MAG TPA: YicC/YloC family endoribonuclease [Gemmatimonadota bacterium]|nr:YicC/YloC family endoribonuclease [Gemmatimonadota bacterium]
MIRSMTGFGRGEAAMDGHRFQVEVKSVNHRYFNAHVRMPREYAHLESRVAAMCSERVERGHVQVLIEVEAGGTAAARGPALDREVLDRYLEIAETLEGHPGVTKRVSVESLLTLPGVLVWDAKSEPVADEIFLGAAGEALSRALDGLIESRSVEGAALERDFRERIGAIEALRGRIAELAPRREERERERLLKKVAELLESAGETLDARIAQEIVLLADRLDVSEELTRMRAHLDHFEAELTAAAGGVGRKLTFLLQELGREANTIGAKGNDAEIQQAAIEMKAELERMREQAENVE